MSEPIKFSFTAQLTQAGIGRTQHYKDKRHGGGSGEGRFVPILNAVFDANRGDTFISDRMYGQFNLHLMDTELVHQIAARWWEQGLKEFDHGTRHWEEEDRGRIRFRVTIEEIQEG